MTPKQNDDDQVPGSQEQARVFAEKLVQMCYDLGGADAFGLYLLQMALTHFNGVAQVDVPNAASALSRMP